MKHKIKIKSLLTITSFIVAILLITISCETKKGLFEYEVLPSYHDGIMNGDEEGIDCGGNSGTPCPSCYDGIQNGEETGVDCGGPDCPECPEATPRYDAYLNTGLPYFFTFELEDSGEGIAEAEDNSVIMNYGTVDPAGGDQIVGKYNRPEGLIADGYSDFKFEKFDAPIDFSTFNKFNLRVFIPSSNDFGNPATFLPTVEIIFLDSSNGAFWETWTVLSTEVSPEDFDTWVKLGFDGGDGLAGATIYDTIAIRIGGSNHTSAATFYVADFIPTESLLLPVQDGTPRADELKDTGLLFFHTFESVDAAEGIAVPESGNTVDVVYGAADPGISPNGVGIFLRPSGLVADGFSDFKFEKFDDPIDFSTYKKFQLDFYAPTSNDYAADGNFQPQVELIFLDSANGEFWTTWTVMSHIIESENLNSWQTVVFDGSAILPPAGVNYDTVAIRVGGSNHQIGGTFYIKDFKSIE